ncbi:hypothetical protein KAI87_02815 [Myxococcota bacterium]|nr:hypothetical protein [Myxococcota bacterium]
MTDPSSKSPGAYDEESSYIGVSPIAAQKKSKRVLGKMDDESSVSALSPDVRGALQEARKKRATGKSKDLSAGGVGLRKATPAAARELGRTPGVARPHVLEKAETVRERVREQREKRRQDVWDKLDAARQKAEEKIPRIEAFNPVLPEDESYDE